MSHFAVKKVVLYTDGACSGNPGPGGWGCILLYKGHEKVLSGFSASTTNNRMELEAPIRGLEALREACVVDVYTDSRYVCDAFLRNWIRSWQAHNWVRAGNQPVKNIDLWKILIQLCSRHQVRWHHVKGHADNEYNNRCDALATGEIARHRSEHKN